jgi:hypothetical protein
MLQFRTLQLSDRDWVQRALQTSDFSGCEYSFANNLAWRRSADTRITRYKDFYISVSLDTEDGIPTFLFPAGSGDFRDVLGEMQETAHAMGHPLRIAGVTADTLPILEAHAPGAFTAVPYPDGFDYVYQTADLIALSGKKYHKKRNHLMRFWREHENAVFSEMTPADFDACIAQSVRFYNEKDRYTDRSSVAEQFAIHTYFSHFQELGLCGGVLRVGDDLVGFSIGEPLCRDMFVTHIEKADIRYHGAYPALMQAFTAHFAKSYRFLNREEDLGIEGLRRSKQSYHPIRMVEKMMCTF